MENYQIGNTRVLASTPLSGACSLEEAEVGYQSREEQKMPNTGNPIVTTSYSAISKKITQQTHASKHYMTSLHLFNDDYRYRGHDLSQFIFTVSPLARLDDEWRPFKSLIPFATSSAKMFDSDDNLLSQDTTPSAVYSTSLGPDDKHAVQFGLDSQFIPLPNHALLTSFEKDISLGNCVSKQALSFKRGIIQDKLQQYLTKLGKVLCPVSFRLTLEPVFKETLLTINSYTQFCRQSGILCGILAGSLYYAQCFQMMTDMVLAQFDYWGQAMQQDGIYLDENVFSHSLDGLTLQQLILAKHSLEKVVELFRPYLSTQHIQSLCRVTIHIGDILKRQSILDCQFVIRNSDGVDHFCKQMTNSCILYSNMLDNYDTHCQRLNDVMNWFNILDSGSNDAAEAKFLLEQSTQLKNLICPNSSQNGQNNRAAQNQREGDRSRQEVEETENRDQPAEGEGYEIREPSSVSVLNITESDQITIDSQVNDNLVGHDGPIMPEIQLNVQSVQEKCSICLCSVLADSLHEPLSDNPGIRVCPNGHIIHLKCAKQQFLTQLSISAPHCDIYENITALDIQNDQHLSRFEFTMDEMVHLLKCPNCRASVCRQAIRIVVPPHMIIGRNDYRLAVRQQRRFYGNIVQLFNN